MISLRKTYRTALSPEEIGNWITRKSKEKTGSFGLKRYDADISDNGFRIKQLRINNSHSMFPAIVGNYVDFQKKVIDIKIRANVFGVIFIIIFWIAGPLGVVGFHRTILYGTPLNINDRIPELLFLLGMLILLTFLFLIRPITSTRKWIESELKLEEITENQNP